MTPEELQEIIDEVLQAVRTNSKTIAQLTEAVSPVDGDYIELSGGRKVSIATLKTIFSGGGGGGVVVVQTTGQSTTAVMSQKAVTEALAGAGGGDWELLVDNTTTDEVVKWAFAQGDNGQVFDEYKEILVFFQCQPAAKTSNLRLCWSGDNPWTNKPYVGFQNTNTSATTLGLVRLEHTPLGIVASFLKSFNNTSLSGDLSYSSGSGLNWTTLQASNQATTTYPFDSEIKYITLGSYQAVIGVGSRIIVYGKK